MRGAAHWRGMLVLAFLLCLSTRHASAVNPETLFMPGPLTAAHQKLEADCTSCHDRRDRARETQLCLACHKAVAADITGHRRFHGHLAGIESAQCRACHVEHQGRDADIMKLSRDQFDHGMTDFPLQGAHVLATCDSCHPPNKKKAFRDAPHDCASCHARQEPHAGKLGNDCASCHDSRAWQHVQFNHDKTAFALQDKHQNVRCVECHFGNRYKETPTRCVSCHAPDDVHRGERGAKCADCHTTAGWKTSRFDHGKQTGFTLQGAHTSLDCQACHRSGNLHEKLPRQCTGCHQGQDAHAGRFGSDCARCHQADKWQSTTFNHARDARWELPAGHAQLECHACHTGVVSDKKLPTDCGGCHRASDIHAARLGNRCEDCHTPDDWKSVPGFDHDLTRFPLLGLHVAVTCAECHADHALRVANVNCVGCHKSNDVHKGSMGSRCDDCHSPNGWRLWEFDHAKRTGFALVGAHAPLACAACHTRPPAQLKLKSDCIACHSADDVHIGQFGSQCQRCHGTATFKTTRQY